MAALSTIVGIASLAVGVVSTVQANKEAKKALGFQQQVQREQGAANKTAQMQERRSQIREERIKRARIMQAAQGTGTAGGSGEAGAIGGMGTQLSSNLGQNLGAVDRANNISIFSQQAADASQSSQMFSSLGNLGFQAAGAASSIFPKSNPTTATTTTTEPSVDSYYGVRP